MNDHRTTDQGLSRRRLFEVLGLSAAGAAGLSLAGCSKAEPKQKKGQAEFHGAYPYQVPPDGHYNAGGTPYAPQPHFLLVGSPYLDLLLMPGAYYHWTQKKYEYYLAEKSEFAKDGSTFTVTLRDGLKWSDGSPLTSDDFLATLWVQKIQNAPAWESITKVEAPDKKTVVVHLSKPSAIIDRFVLKSNIIPAKTYGSWADRAQKAGSDAKAAGALNKEFQNFRPKEFLTSGPFSVDPKSITDSRMTLVRNAHGYAADRVKFQKIVLFNGETPAVAPLVQAKSVDYATHGFTVAQETSFKKVGYRILRPPNYSGPALFFNFGKLPEFHDPRARQALAHAINRPDNGAAALGRSGVGVKYMAGFSDIQVPDWVAADQQSKLDSYDHDPAKAEALLKAAGWKKQGKAWHTPQGKPASYIIKYPSEYADWSASGDDVARQLSAFGIKLTPQGITFNQFSAETDKGNWEMCIQQWGSSQHPHPYFAFVQDLFTHNIPVAQNQGGKGMDFDLKVKTKAAGKLDLEAVINASGQGLDEAAQKANITKAALAFNELLPIVPLFERYGNNPCLDGVRVTKFPPASDPDIKNAAYADNFVIIGLIAGSIQPV